jgi:hypothetical protein
LKSVVADVERPRQLQIEVHTNGVRDVDANAFADARSGDVEDKDLRDQRAQRQQLDAPQRAIGPRHRAKDDTVSTHGLPGVVDADERRGDLDSRST